MGAIFRKGVTVTTWQDVKAACEQADLPIAVTALTDQAMDLRKAPLNTMAVVIGSEGQGVRPEILHYAQKQLIIPMNEHCESLNAAIAAAIVMWQMKQ
jgi:TrmH family RNA methyltransferase